MFKGKYLSVLKLFSYWIASRFMRTRFEKNSCRVFYEANAINCIYVMFRNTTYMNTLSRILHAQSESMVDIHENFETNKHSGKFGLSQSGDFLPIWCQEKRFLI